MKKVLNNVMVDIETLGTERHSAPIISIGAATFNGEGVVDTFYRVIDLASTLEVSRVEAGTLKFWLHYSKREEFANLIFSKETVSIDQALNELIEFLPTGRDVNYWSQGHFDYPILESSMRKLGLKLPGQYYQQTDARTFVNINSAILGLSKTDLEEAVPRSGTHHNALDDVITQIDRVLYITNTIKGLVKKPSKKK